MATEITVQREIYPGPLTFGRSIRGKLAGAMRESQIALVDSHDKLGSVRLPTPLPDESGLQDMTDGEFAGFNLLFPELVRAFGLNRRELVRDMYLEGGARSNGEHFLPILFDIYRSQESEVAGGPVARIVFGASEQMSLRSLSYMLPVLLHMQHVQEVTGKTIPQVQLIFAKYTSGGLNGLDAEKVTNEVAQYACIASTFIEKFFPTLRDRIVFLEDMPLDEVGYQKELMTIAESLEGQVDMSAFLGKAARRDAAGSESLYTAAHVVLHETAATDVLRPLVDTSGMPLFSQQRILPATAVINYGGKQEIPFYQFRQVARALSLPFLPTLQLFSRHVVPPYYMAVQGKDIGLSEALRMSAQERRAFIASLEPKRTVYGLVEGKDEHGAIRMDLEFLDNIARMQESLDSIADPLGVFLDEQRDIMRSI